MKRKLREIVVFVATTKEDVVMAVFDDQKECRDFCEKNDLVWTFSTLYQMYEI